LFTEVVLGTHLVGVQDVACADGGDDLRHGDLLTGLLRRFRSVEVDHADPLGARVHRDAEHRPQTESDHVSGYAGHRVSALRSSATTIRSVV